MNTRVPNKNKSLANQMIKETETGTVEKNAQVRAYIYALLETVNELIPKITRKQLPTLVEYTKKNVNTKLKQKGIKISNVELSNIINNVLNSK
jgi:hypothetical protein